MPPPPGPGCIAPPLFSIWACIVFGHSGHLLLLSCCRHPREPGPIRPAMPAMLPGFAPPAGGTPAICEPARHGPGAPGPGAPGPGPGAARPAPGADGCGAGTAPPPPPPPAAGGFAPPASASISDVVELPLAPDLWAVSSGPSAGFSAAAASSAFGASAAATAGAGAAAAPPSPPGASARRIRIRSRVGNVTPTPDREEAGPGQAEPRRASVPDSHGPLSFPVCPFYRTSTVDAHGRGSAPRQTATVG